MATVPWNRLSPCNREGRADRVEGIVCAQDATALLKTPAAASQPPAPAVTPLVDGLAAGNDSARSRRATVLGLSFFFHDSAAALVSDGQIVAAAAEERFCRRKHTNEFPKRAIAYCLDAANLRSINDLDAIVFYEKPIVKLNRVLETLVEVWPRGVGVFTRGLPGFLTTKVNVYSVIEQALPGYRGPILFAEHHLSHAASAFYCSPYEAAAILTIDGVGEWETTAVGSGRGTEIRLERAIRFPHSVGLLYSALTSYLGFQVNDGEWKVMGLAPYGEPKYVERFRRLVELKPDGSFSLNMNYFVHHYSSEWTAHNARWHALFGFGRREPKANIEQHHEDLARSGQAVVEEIILNLAREARRLSGSDNLVIAGGVGLNSVANWKIEHEGIFRNVWIQPAAGDDGGAVGAALLASQVVFNSRRCAELTDACLGPEYSDREMLAALVAAGFTFERCDDAALVERAADLVAGGRVIGWFRGRMEFGPRALGARSILADATNPAMKAIINSKIKYREYFRPFAPAVPLDDVHRYFDVPPGTSMPFMLKVPRVRPEVTHLIPAVTHADGSGRVQTVTCQSNPLYYALLKAVGRRTGVPIIVNTSFNVRGEPIVCSPEDAISCFLQTDIDALVLGNYVVTDKPTPALDIEHGYARSDALEATNGQQAHRTRGGSPHTASLDVPRPVADFFKQLPVAFYSNALDTAIALRRANLVKAYRPAHAFLKATPDASVLDVACGSGWFATSCAYHYGARVTGVDVNPAALADARSVARLIAPTTPVEFVEASLDEFRPSQRFDVVNALENLHQMANFEAAVRRIADWVEPGGYLQVGLYNRRGRKAFVDYFDRLWDRGASQHEMHDEFRRLNRHISDATAVRAWCDVHAMHRDQPQRSWEEIDDLLRSAGFTIEATSLNGFGRLPSRATIEELEQRAERLSRDALYRTQRYYPGFFIVWARRG
jgi:carbamoyltransferase